MTKYAYDAAGRLIQEGDKSYTYAWLDKLTSVSEAGKVSANFSYHLDGQIAGVTYADGRSENYLWDGLALIHRDGTELLNEPAITGGNPVLSGDKVLFNDMLGNTLGVKDQSSYQPIKMTAFGESDNVNAFFTGKPLVGELGYAFLFRNYRPEQGKWQTADPLGYPDGWNNFAYVNNLVIIAIDRYGTEVLICREVVDGIVKHQWIEVHRGGEITAAAGFYPSGGSLYGQGQINMGSEESHINDSTKDVVAVYRTSAMQEKALMQEILKSYVPNPPFYSVYPPQYVCYDWTEDISEIIEEAWNLDNDLDNASLVELSQWGNDKPSKNIDDINKMPE